MTAAIVLLVIGMGSAILNFIKDGPPWVSILGGILSFIDPVAQFIEKMHTETKNGNPSKPIGRSYAPPIAEVSDVKKHAMSVLRKYDIVFGLVYSYFIVSIMPCADIFIGRLMIQEGELRTLSGIIGDSWKAAIIACWFLFWISFMLISSFFSRRVLKLTGKIDEQGGKRIAFSIAFAFLGLLVFLSPQATETINSLYDELRKLFSVAPEIFGTASLLVFFVFPCAVLRGIRKYRKIYNA